MEYRTLKSWPTENLNMGMTNHDEGLYYWYRLARPVICTINFRCHIMQGSSQVKIVPIKCGEGRKYTQEGVIKVPYGFDPHVCSQFKGVKIDYSHATATDFQNAGQAARIKIYFRGFPLDTSRDEIGYFFSTFGKLEYLYIMAMSKTRAIQKSIQGYFIFKENNDAHQFLAHHEELYFKGLRLFCEIYKTNKKKKCLSEPKLPYFGFSQNHLNVSTPGSVPGRLTNMNVSSIPNHLGTRDMQAVAEENQEVHRLSFDRSFDHQPYLQKLDQIKGNSSDQSNIRFNICRGGAVARAPYWGQ